MAGDDRTTGVTEQEGRGSAARPTPAPPLGGVPAGHNPWPALWAWCIGFFMILVDSTIVSVATPAIMRGLDTDVNAVIWVTSAYLLAYAVPLLITGRLGDRFGPKYVYLVGLAVFTLASLWCGLTGTIEMLIIARVVQGLGAVDDDAADHGGHHPHLPAASRGQAMGLWGATAGVAILVGPILGGLLVDGPGWEWIFFINVPVGVVAFVLAARLVPKLADAQPHASTGSAWRSRRSACSCSSSASRRARPTTGAPSPGSSRCRCSSSPGIVVLGAVHRAGRPQHARAAACRSACSATATSRWPTSRSPRSASRSPRWPSRSCSTPRSSAA